MDYTCIGLLGDSIGQGYFSNNNEGWFVKYINMLNKNHPKIYSYQNMAVEGERVTDVFHRLHNEALTKNLNVLFIAIGINDTTRWNSVENPMDISEGLRYEMWRKILSTAKKNIDHIFVVSLLPVAENRYPALGCFNRTRYHLNSDIDNYNNFLKELCKEYDIKFIDVTKKWLENNLDNLLFDSEHPNDEGHKLIANEIFNLTKDFF